MKDLGIKQNYPLNKLTTFKIGGPAKYYKEVREMEDVERLIKLANDKGLDILVIGGGSNLLVSDQGFDGLVIRVDIKGMKVLDQGDNHVKIEVGAGEIFDHLVLAAVKKDWWGVENMSGIPGRVGGFVVQNAGAYGQETVDVVESVDVYNIIEGKVEKIYKKDCQFGYRTSLFNNNRDKYLIFRAVVALNKPIAKKYDGNLAQLEYPDLKKYFKEKGIKNPNIKQVREAVIFIRSNKFPSWGKYGNSGSFFKNLLLNQDEYKVLYDNVKRNFDAQVVEKLKQIKNKFPIDGAIKIPTNFLIDICGLKGLEINGVKVNEKQPVALINQSGKATSTGVMEMFKKVRQEVYQKTGMKLEPETRLVGFSQKELDVYFELGS